MNQDNSRLELDISLLLKELGLDNIEVDQKAAMAELVKGIIIAKFKVSLVDSLDEKSLAYLDTVSNNTEETMRFLSEDCNLNVNQLLLAIAQQSREEIMQDVEYARGLIDGMNKGSDNSAAA